MVTKEIVAETAETLRANGLEVFVVESGALMRLLK